MARLDFEPKELLIVQSDWTVRMCLALEEDTPAIYSDINLIYLGIEKSLPVLRQSFGHRHYIIEGQTIERMPGMTKVILDLDFS